MATIDYIQGEARVLGFVMDQYDGTPLPLDGIGLRLTIHVPGNDIRIDGTGTTGEIDLGAGPIRHPSIASFALSPANMPTCANLYRISLDIDDGTGWRVFQQSFIDIRGTGKTNTAV